MANRVLQLALAAVIVTVCGALPRPHHLGSAFKTETASKGEFPWQAQLRKQGSHVCGAILVRQRWLLTAAHCLSGLEPLTAYQVVLGEHDVSAEEGTEQRRQLSQVVFFRGQLGDSRSPRSSPKNDIALIQLDREAIYNEWVKPITLPEADDVFTGVSGEAAGWGVSGATVHAPIYPRRLQKVQYTLLDGARCRRSLHHFRFNKHTMVCAAAAAGGSLCWGDSGGALALHNGTQTVLAAVASWGVDCGFSSLPSVFVNVPHHVTWIRSVVDASQ